MRRFTNGAVVSFVEDDDLRIPAYLANGWKEEIAEASKPIELHNIMRQAVKDANESEPQIIGKKTKATDNKVNAAIKSKIVAAAESEEIDDGLIIKKGGNQNGRSKRG